VALRPAALRISDPEELPRTAAALGRLCDGLVRVHDGARATRRRIEDQVRAAVVQLEGELRRAERRRQGVPPEDEAGRRAAEVAVLAAARAVADARRQRDRTEMVLTDLERSLGQQVREAEALAEKGNRGLRRFWEQLGRASSAFATAVGRHHVPSGVADPRRITASGGGRGGGGLLDTVVDHLRDELVDHARDEIVEAVGDEVRRRYPEIGDTGRVLVPLEDLVDPDPVSGPADFLKISVREMERGLELLEQRILPTLRRGGGPLEMARLDAQAGTTGSPSGFVAVYEAFFGGEERAVRVERRADGRLEVVAGRHRVWVARRLHLDALPVLVRGGS
jgi:hypothetical protein